MSVHLLSSLLELPTDRMKQLKLALVLMNVVHLQKYSFSNCEKLQSIFIDLYNIEFASECRAEHVLESETRSNWVNSLAIRSKISGINTLSTSSFGELIIGLVMELVRIGEEITHCHFSSHTNAYRCTQQLHGTEKNTGKMM